MSTDTTHNDPAERGYKMDTSDRCDYCNAQAYVRVIKSSQELDFCGHDYYKNADALEVAGWKIMLDTRELLVKRSERAEVY